MSISWVITEVNLFHKRLYVRWVGVRPLLRYCVDIGIVYYISNNEHISDKPILQITVLPVDMILVLCHNV